MKTFRFAVTALAITASSFAQTPGASSTYSAANARAAQQQRDIGAATSTTLATSDCAYTFTSGADNTFLKYCVTVNGNITQFESPGGHEHVAVGVFAEGYLICDGSVHADVSYFDYAGFGDSGNWQPATLVRQTATNVVIARTTVDGVWTLTQSIVQAPSDGLITVAMQLRNNSTTARPFTLARYMDVDADSTFANTLDVTRRTAFAWQPSRVDGTPNGGIAMKVVGTPPLTQFAATSASPLGPICSDPKTATGTQVAVDGSVAQIFLSRQPLAPDKTVNITVRYEPL